MRRAFLTLSSAGIIASLIFSSCTIEKDDDDDDDDDNGGSTSTSASGGNTSTTKSPFQGGSTSENTNLDTIVQPPCPGLVDAIKGKTGDTNTCGETEKPAQYAKINMLIVMDKSGSMTDTPPAYGKSKWESAKASLGTALKADDPLVSYGFMLYPYKADAAAAGCVIPSGTDAVNIPIQAASASVPAIHGLLAQTAPGGGTPTAGALKAAYEYYTVGAGRDLIGQKYVLLVTDGGPNCNAGITCPAATCTANLDQFESCGTGIANCCDPSFTVGTGEPANTLCLDDVAVNGQLQALREAGVGTFVIGIPGSEVYASYLDSFADMGGYPVVGKAHKYYEVINPQDLELAVQQITTSLVRDCNIPLVRAAEDKTKINVAVDCNALPQKAADQTDNWVYHEDTNTIEILGNQCAAIKSTGAKRLDVVTGCATIIAL